MNNDTAQNATETAVVGGGCFWCLDAQFRLVEGVTQVASGYAGGTGARPTYEQVCSGRTGHAEVVRLEFQPAQISYEAILRLFFHGHDPTTLNRQGPDVGTQYRSVILYTSDVQRQTAEKVVAELQREFRDPIVTEIAPLKEFYEAEEYHQDFFRKNPNQSYCRLIVAPKVRKFMEQGVGK